MPGPLPKPDGARRRRNAPTIPTTQLPAGGREAPSPRLPGFTKLAKSGKAWWRWAWQTPQSAGWAPGMECVVARRASLEDDLLTLDTAPHLDVADVLMIEESEATKQLEWFIRRLASMATGRLAVIREMRELDRALGLTPKAMADLRWSIAPDEVAEARAAQTRPSLAAIDPTEEDPRRLLA